MPFPLLPPDGTFRGANAGGVAAVASSISVVYSTIPGVAAGDTALVAVGWNFNGTTINTPAGWTLVLMPTGNSGSQLALFSKTLSSGDVTAGSVTVTFNATTRASWVVGVYQGAMAFGTPVTAVGNATLTTGGSVTTVNPSAEVVTIWTSSPSAPPAVTLAYANGTTDAQGKTTIGTSTQTTTAFGRRVALTPGSYSAGTVTGASGAGANQYIAFEAGVSTGAALSRSASDSAPATDTTSASVVLARPVSDTAAAVDTTAQTTARSRSTSDSAPATDTVGRASTRSRAQSDSAPATDVTVRSALPLARAVSDTGAGTDVDARSTTRSRAQSDTGAGTDATSRALVESRGLTDSAPATDTTSTSGAGGTSRSCSDTAAATDSVARTATHPRALTDAAAGTDTDARSKAASRVLSDAAAATDVDARATTRSRSTSDSAPATDAEVGQLSRGRATADTAAASDTTSRQISVRILTADAAPAADLARTAAAYARAVLETTTISDSTVSVVHPFSALELAPPERTILIGTTRTFHVTAGGRRVAVEASSHIITITPTDRTYLVQPTTRRIEAP